MDVSVTRAVYRFEELSEDAKWRAIEVLREQAWDDFDSDMVSEEITTRFAWEAAHNDGGPYSRKAFRDRFGIDIEWRVGCSQSDYAAVTGTLYRSDAPYLAWPDGISAVFIKNGRTWSWATSASATGEDGGIGEAIYHGPMMEAAQEFVRNLNHTIYEWAQQACEDYTSTDYVIDQHQASGVPYQWNEDGTQAPAIFWRES